VEDQCAGFKDMPKKISTIACTPSDWIRNEVRWGRRALGLDGRMLADERQEKGAVKKRKTLLKLTYLFVAQGERFRSMASLADRIEAVH